ncbi:MAG: GNAT family N-acetyltransferase [Deltaproteobacteria bacterium]|nr:GNAT family N-acetyltransferase [Deltaproteobacteria bacterium]
MSDLSGADESWQSLYAAKRASAADAVSRIPRGKHVFIGSGAAEPVGLVEELVAQADRFADNTIVHLLTLGPAPYVQREFEKRFRHNAFFIGPNVREAVHEGRADYTPVFLSQIPALIRSRRMPVDVALIQTTPPDRYGYVNLGVSVDIVLAAIGAASLVVAEINPRMPTIHGSGYLPMARVDAWVLRDASLPEIVREEVDEVALQIGENVARLIDDRSTLQIGIGQIPDAVLRALSSHKDLGVWSEMFSDGVVELIQSGNITGRYKTIHPNKVSASFCFGTREFYGILDRNPTFTFHPSDYINDPLRIARQYRMVAINSALQVDLTGQVCSDSIGTKFYSGIGGQVDFIRGASLSPEGVPIIALRSTARAGSISRIVGTLDAGAGVVTSRGDVRHVVTEYGVADLLGKSVRERAMALIGVAHPDFRSELLGAAKQRRYVFVDQVASTANYPTKYEHTIVTGRGEVLLRPSRLTDESKMSELFYSLSDETIYKRWLHYLKRMPHHDLLYYLDVDYDRRMSVVAEVQQEGRDPDLVGVGHYMTDPATGLADVAFLVRDDWQGEGLGKGLLRCLIEVAREKGVRGFSADVLATNRKMMAVFLQSGLKVESSLEEGVYRLTMPLGPVASAAKAPAAA